MASHTCSITRSSFFHSCTQAPGAGSQPANRSSHAPSAALWVRKSSHFSSHRVGVPVSAVSAPKHAERYSFVHGTPLKWEAKAGHRVSGHRGSALSAVCAEGVADLGDSNFESEVVNSPIPVLVDFHASWCGPCKLVAPLMNWAAETYDGKLKVVKVDVEANPKTTEKYRVYGLPTVLIFESGKVLTHQEGAITKAKLDKLLKEKLPALA